MKIRVIFPNGRAEEVKVNIAEFSSLYEVADYVVEILAERYAMRVRPKRRIEVKERYKAGLRKWLPAKIIVAILEAIEKKKEEAEVRTGTETPGEEKKE